MALPGPIVFPQPPTTPEVVVDLRILQANERTLLAWIRTGLGLMAFGFVVARLGVWLRYAAVEPGSGSVMPLLTGAVLVLLGTTSITAAALRYLRIRRALLAGVTVVPSPLLPFIVALAVSTLGAVLAVYLLVRQ